MAKERLTIGELARRTGTTVKTLRFYSDEGLLPPAGRSPSGYRLYGEDALVRVDLVRTLREAGLGLDAIKEVLQQETSLADALRLRLAAVEAHIASLQRIGAALRAALRSEPNEDDIRRLCAVTRLSHEERKAVIERFYENVMHGIDVDEEWKREVIAKSMPKFPDPTTPAQLDAWIELVELVSDPTLVANLRRMAQVTIDKVELAAIQHAGQAITEAVQDAVVRGIAPASEEGRAIAERYASAFAEGRKVALSDDVRRDLRARFSVDPRQSRYWELLAVLNDTPETARQLAQGKWISQAVLHHLPA
ncbi:MerR family transcriptional regulator [Pendulispora albinea]|uniref:MerR family transcriptional regulator n=1 Tax=Pendulispora albinea TaxID=2741071 RepID=A0ABZ2LWA9_9BACT